MLGLIEHGRKVVERQEVIDRLDIGPNAADHVGLLKNPSFCGS